MDQFVNSPNRVPSFQAKFQSGSELVFRQTAGERTFAKGMVFFATGVIFCCALGVKNLALNQGKKPAR
eukprot:m.9305 g.9305  ORF g.9305 m.9305 type:complete len:68 (-) comp7164_c0_seq1:143-346(-)